MRELEIPRFEFLENKYGTELLIDAGRIESIPGYVLTERIHRSNFYEIAVIDEGAGELSLDLSPYPVAPGHAIFFSPGQIRQWRLTRPARGNTIFFTGGFITGFFSDPLFLHKLRYFHNYRQPLVLALEPGEHAEISSRMLEMQRELTSLQGDSAHMLRAILYQLLVRLHRIYSTRNGVEADTEGSPILYRFRSLLEEHFRAIHGVRDYAEMLSITPGYLSDVTRRFTGSSAKEMIEGRILVEAKRLVLYSGWTAQTVAARLGFHDPSYFSRFFKRATGHAPGEYRRRVLKKYHKSPDS